MNNINMLLKDINNYIDIPFKLTLNQELLYISDNFSDSSILESRILKVGTDEYFLVVNYDDRKVLELLSYCVRKLIFEYEYEKNKLVLSILEGKKVLKDKIFKAYPFLIKEYSMIVIFAEENTQKILELIEEGYTGVSTIKVPFEDKIIILGDLDNVKEHALSIYESLSYDFCGKFMIFYSRVNDYSKLKEMYDICSKKISAALKFDITEGVFGEKDLIFEEAIDSLSPEEKTKLIKNFGEGFEKIDSEMFKTIDSFLKCGLNLSTSAKDLFIHRNTLIYRLDKVYKETGFDLRDFDDAVIFKLVRLLWKQYKS